MANIVIVIAMIHYHCQVLQLRQGALYVYLQADIEQVLMEFMMHLN